MASETLQLGIDSTGALTGARQFERATDQVKRSAREADAATGKLDGGIGKLGASAAAMTGAFRVATGVLASFGVTVGIGVVAGAVREANAAVDRLTDSTRRLSASSRTSGVELGALRAIARQAGEDFILTTAESNDYGVAIGRLVERTGDLRRSQEALNAVMILAANEGISAADAIGIFESALRGSDEATEALFAGAQPSAIYAAYADAVGKTTQELTLAEKSQAVFNVAIERAARLGGTFAGTLTDLERAQREANRELDLAKVAFGEAYAPSRVALIEAQAEALRTLGDVIAENRDEIRQFADWMATAVSLAGDLAGAFSDGGPVAFNFGRRVFSRGLDEESPLSGIAGATAGDGGVTDLVQGILARSQTGRAGGVVDAPPADEDLEQAIRDLDATLQDSAKIEAAFAASFKGSVSGVKGFRPNVVGGAPTAPGIIQSAWIPPEVPGDDPTRAIAEGVRGLIDLGDAVGLLNDNARRALSGVTGLVGSLDSFNSATSTLGQVGAAFGIAGAAAGIIGSLVNNETERERNRILRENNRALDRLRQSFDGFGNRDDLLRGIGVIDSVQAGGGGTLGIIDRFADHMDFLSQLADEFGITLEGNVIGGLEQLEEALRLATDRAFEFAKTLNGAQARQNALNEIFDRTSPEDQLASQYGILSQFAGGVLSQFGGANLNVGTAAGRSALEQALRDAITAYADGSLDPALLGQFASGQEFVDLLLGTDSALDAFTDSLQQASGAVTDFPRAVNVALFRAGVTTGPDGSAAVGSPYPTSRRNEAPAASSTALTIGTLTVVNEAGDTPEALARKVFTGVEILSRQGVRLRAPGLVTTP